MWGLYSQISIPFLPINLLQITYFHTLVYTCTEEIWYFSLNSCYRRVKKLHSR